MSGINRATYKSILEENIVRDRITRKIECVFLAHQKRDADACRKIANYLINADIDVYFDEFDDSLRTSDPKKVVESIRRGIEKSSHMICVVSRNTFESNWVPFEVGYGYDKTLLSVLRLKSLSKSLLPDYLKIVPAVNDIYDLNSFISYKRKTEGALLERVYSIRNYNDSDHPLLDIMDKI